MVVVTDNLKTQESFQQDLETWLSSDRASSSEGRGPAEAGSQPSTLNPQPFFYPAWDVLPHEGKLPHADTISDRLQTLVQLSGLSTLNPAAQQSGAEAAQLSTLVVTSVTALLQKTFRPGEIQKRTRLLARGDKINPLDLIEWLEEQGCEPEAQVTQKGEIALRGGILDVWPLTSPWPVRLEFFGDELESLRHFDPLTQISRGEIVSVTLPPAGELGLLKREAERGVHAASTSVEPAATGLSSPHNNLAAKRPPDRAPLATLLDYLPPETIFLLCEPEQLAIRADEYAQQIPENDPFFVPWTDFLAEMHRRGFTSVKLADQEMDGTPASGTAQIAARDDQRAVPEAGAPIFTSLDAFRPLGERAPDPQIAEAQRREFFNQLHRWLRQDHAVHVFCNNDGERQRFTEIWAELVGQSSSLSPSEKVSGKEIRAGLEACPAIHIGTLARGFFCEAARFVVVTDAEIFGRYKIQQPRRLKSPHALATRSALDIDFTELEEGDFVVHLQYGIGKFLGLKNLPMHSVAADVRRRTEYEASSASLPRRLQEPGGTECLVIEYAPRHPGDEPPKLYVPVTEAHLVGKYVGVGKAHPPLNPLGGTRWNKAKEQAERAVRDVAAELLQIQAVRESQAGHCISAGRAVAARIRGRIHF